jgi:hypothetical protein
MRDARSYVQALLDRNMPDLQLPNNQSLAVECIDLDYGSLLMEFIIRLQEFLSDPNAAQNATQMARDIGEYIVAGITLKTAMSGVKDYTKYRSGVQALYGDLKKVGGKMRNFLNKAFWRQKLLNLAL